MGFTQVEKTSGLFNGGCWHLPGASVHSSSNRFLFAQQNRKLKRYPCSRWFERRMIAHGVFLYFQRCLWPLSACNFFTSFRKCFAFFWDKFSLHRNIHFFFVSGNNCFAFCKNACFWSTVIFTYTGKTFFNQYERQQMQRFPFVIISGK